MNSNPTLIVLKTAKQHIVEVTKSQKHALPTRMTRAKKGDLLLIAEIQDSGPALVKYVMRFKNQYPDDARESDAIWGKNEWKFMIEGEDGCWLTAPFTPAKLKPEGPYGRGGTFAYVRADDAEEFRRDGRLAPFI